MVHRDEVASADVYAANEQFLADALAAVAYLVKTYAEVKRPPDKAGGSPFFSEGERVLKVLEEAAAGPAPTVPANAEARLEEVWERGQRSAAAGAKIPLLELGDRFGLDRVDVCLLLLAAVPYLVADFEEVYGYLNNDMTRRGLTPALASAILDTGGDAAALRRLLPGAPLRRCRILEVENGALTVPAAVLQYVVAGGAAPLDGESGAAEPPGEPEDERAARRAAAVYARDPGRFHFVVAGDRPRARSFVAAASRLCGLSDTYTPAEAEEPRAALRDAGLASRALVLVDPGREVLTGYERAAQAMPPASLPLVFVLFEEPESFRCGAKSRYAFDFPGPARREVYWRFYGARAGLEVNGEAGALAYDYRLSGDDVAAIVGEEAERLAGADGGVKPDLRARCREYSARVVSRHVRPARVNFRLEDIVLPPANSEQLAELMACVRNRRTVLEEWGFAAKLSLGVGVSALFSGPSGTGKTMAAGIIAEELELPLFKVDLSSVVSKYIGETEKNLKDVFEAAEKANAVLFFDEADALFGKRTEVKDAHDRYANIEVSYLLQQMEEYSGLAILATNKKEDLDRAFLRRIQFVVEFPFPNETLREEIWRKVFPAGVPISADVDFCAIARTYSLAGGNIKNAALLAAYLAAEGRTAVGPQELHRALKREYEKLGKIYPGD
jgi:hypothetical protein